MRVVVPSRIARSITGCLRTPVRVSDAPLMSPRDYSEKKTLLLLLTIDHDDGERAGYHDGVCVWLSGGIRVFLQ